MRLKTMIYRILSRTALWTTLHGLDWPAALIYRVCCPYPIIDDWSASACIRAGVCGCGNKPKE